MYLVALFVLFLCTAVEGRAAQDIPVVFPSGSLTLEGTLSVPDGDGPFPAVVLVHGSGPQDRDQTTTFSDQTTSCLFPGLAGSTVRSFRDIANGLADSGIAVLRYDKRTYTYATELEPKLITPYDFVEDIHSAVDFLKTRPEIDISAIMLLGHSQGGNLIPIVARERTDIAVLMALAAPAIPLDTTLARQVRYIARHCGDSASGEAQALQLLQVFGRIRSGTWDPNIPVMGAYEAFWRDWIRMVDSTVAVYQQLQQPTLFLQGTADYNVTTEDAAVFAEALDREPVDVYVLDGLTHMFTPADHPEVAPVVVDTIVAWLRQHGPVTTSVVDSGEPTGRVRHAYDGDVPVLSVPSSGGPWTVRIVDAFGRTVEHRTAERGEIIRFSASRYTSGWYGYTATGAGTTATGTFVVRR